MKKSLIYIAALTLIAACNKVESPVSSQDTDILIAQIEQETSTKTYMDAHNNIRWSEGDQVVAFMKSSLGMKYQISEESVGKTSARFVKQATGNSDDLYGGTDWNHNVVYYPYSATAEAEKSNNNYALNIVLPSEQTYAAESFGSGSMAMVAVSEDNTLTFKNILGGMKLQLKGTQKVKSIKLEGKNNEKLSGAATVIAYTDETKPAITMASGASKTITLNCGSGVQLNESTATEFIVALPPVLFSKGFTMTVIDDAGNEQTIQTDKENSVLRSSLLVMPEVTLDKVSQTGDYIDEYGINHGPGVKIGETVWAPVNCGYHATDFKYGKLYQWGRKYGQGYDENDASVPTIEEGGISLITGQHKNKANVFFTSTEEFNYDWLYPQDSKLWNSGSESAPVKTEYDPCPEGWRVPTYAELDELTNNYSSWTTEDNGQSGRWFSGPNSYTATVPQVFFPAAGDLYIYDGDAYLRGRRGTYWSSRPHSTDADYLFFSSISVRMYSSERAFGYSVRCVQE